LPVYRTALEGVFDGVFYIGDMEHDHEVGDGITTDISRLSAGWNCYAGF